jgi:hypothetical protein
VIWCFDIALMVETLVFKAANAGNFYNINVRKTELIYFPENATQFQSWKILSKICVHIIIHQYDRLFMIFLMSGLSACNQKNYGNFSISSSTLKHQVFLYEQESKVMYEAMYFQL